MADLRAFTRELMADAERDLGTGLDWVGPRSEQEIRSGLEKEVGADRWTSLDRSLRDMADEGGASSICVLVEQVKIPSFAGSCWAGPLSSNG